MVYNMWPQYELAGHSMGTFGKNSPLAACKANSKIAIFANDKENVLTEKEIKDEIMILIHPLNDDVETQCIAREVFDNVRNRDISVLKDFMDLLVNKDYQTMYENYR